MKTNKTILQQLLLFMAMALPMASHAAKGFDADTAANGAPADGPGVEGRVGHGGPDGARGPRGHGPGSRGPDELGGPGTRGPGPFGMPFGVPPFMHGLALNEAQQDKVFAILHAQEPYVREQGKAFHKAQAGLHEMAHADKYDDAKAVSLAQAAAQAMSNLDLQRVRTEQKLLAVLTTEQRKQLDQRKSPRPQPQ